MPEIEQPTRASVELRRILDEGGAIASAIRKRFEGKKRSVLWRLTTGRRKPELETAVELRELTRGRIREAWWFEPCEPDQCKACGR